MNKQMLLKNLVQVAEWVASKQRDHDEAVNIMSGCFGILKQAGQRGMTEWLDRKPDRRRVLADVREQYLTPKGNKVLRDLIALTISAVEACIWVDHWLPGALLLQTPTRKPLTKDQLQKMQEGKARQKAALKALKERRNAQMQNKGFLTKKGHSGEEAGNYTGAT